MDLALLKFMKIDQNAKDIVLNYNFFSLLTILSSAIAESDIYTIYTAANLHKVHTMLLDNAFVFGLIAPRSISRISCRIT